jgi:hypothetical protein
MSLFKVKVEMDYSLYGTELEVGEVFDVYQADKGRFLIYVNRIKGWHYIPADYFAPYSAVDRFDDDLDKLLKET